MLWRSNFFTKYKRNKEVNVYVISIQIALETFTFFVKLQPFSLKIQLQ